jgi:hypothetical protein
MTMRRLPALVLVAVMAVAALIPTVMLATHPARTLAFLARGFECSAGRLVPTAALAQETLEFRPLPPESASKLDRVRPRRARGVTITVDRDSIAPLPAVPEAPDAPMIVSRSGDVTRMGSDIRIQKGEVVQGDVFAIKGDVLVDGHVEGSVTSMGGDVVLSSTGRVDGDVAALGGEVREAPGSFVGGERLTAGSARGRRILRKHASDLSEEQTNHVVPSLIWLLIVLGVTWAVARFAPGRTSAAVEMLKREPTTSLGIGALVFILIIPSLFALTLVMTILCITIIGIPLAIAALIGYAAFFVLFAVCGFTVGASVVGERLMGPRSMAPMTLGRAVAWGVVAVVGLVVTGQVLRSIGHGTPLYGFGTFLFVVYAIATWIVITLGGGAWLRSEFATGLFGKWWARRRRGPATMMPPGPGGPPSGVPTAVPAAPVPPAHSPSAYPPPSPPSAFEPPPTPEPPAQG